MEKYEGRNNKETGLLAVDQRDLSAKVYDSLTSEKARKIVMYAIPVGLAVLASGCASIGEGIENILGGS